MRLNLESTTKVVTLNGVLARVWEGTTDSGIAVIAMITRLAVRKESDTSLFERELQECREPSPEAAAIPLRLVL